MRGAGHRRLQAVAGVGLVVAIAAGVAAFARTSESASSARSASAIDKAPAFTAEQLLKAPRSNWLTNGGTTYNQRYAPLNQINTSNVKDVKGVWRTHLRGSGTAAKYSGEGQPLVYNGVMYVTTGNDDVFALSVKTGKILWEHKSQLNQKITTVCCGWLNRGVALGEGRVYLGRLDGKVEALDQLTGKLLWQKQLVLWQRGQTITGAPLYADGRIYIGAVGAEYGTRGFVQAFDAKTGKKLWRFWTIPGPNEPGGNTWPKSDAYLHGGASVWHTPAYDPKLGLLYFSTGNAGPDWYGALRPGKNLFASSIVAVDVKTGKMKWYFQEVHHDIWDYDAPSPVVLYDVKVDGKLRQGIAQAGKTGWLYQLDRTNGKPLYGIDEKKVIQDKKQKTWPTQPFPRTGLFIPHVVTAQEVARIKKERLGPAKKMAVVAAKEMFTPPGRGKLVAIIPGPQGGTNFMPSSYNPLTQMIYVCAAVQTTGEAAQPQEFKIGKTYIGAVIAGFAFNESSGTFTAIDARSGKIVWQKRWPEACYSGSSTTVGNLVFVGRSDGRYQAFDARNGKLLWSFQTGAGANDVGTIFKQDGHEYIALLSAGNSLVASPHGDSVWLFGLNGKLGPVKIKTKGKGTRHAGTPKGPSKQQGNAAAGKKVYAANCSGCHGLTGGGGNGGPDLTTIPTAKNLNRVIAQVTNGGGGMPAFEGQLSQKQIRDVSTYVVQRITAKKK